jgi:hypothetical protein
MNEDNELKTGVSAMLWLLNSLQGVVSRPRRLCTRKTQPRGMAALLLVSATLSLLGPHLWYPTHG